jgi:hypothetical protein
MSNFEVFTLALSWLGVAASAYFAYRAKLSSQEANKINQRLVAIEEEREHDRKQEALKADIVIGRVEAPRELGKRASISIAVIPIVNRGKADATNVQISARAFFGSGEVWQSGKDVIRGHEEITFLPANGGMNIRVFPDQRLSSIGISISWTDGLGNHSKPEQRVSL